MSNKALLDSDGVLISYGYVVFTPVDGQTVIDIPEGFNLPTKEWRWDGTAFVPHVTAEANRRAELGNDPVRTELIEKLRNGTASELEVFVRGRLNANSVTNLATAITFCKRVETAFVQVVKALARNGN